MRLTSRTDHIASILLWSAIENHTAIFIACSPSIKALVVGTLVPFVTSVHSTINEKAKSLRSSQSSSSSPRDGTGSQMPNRYSVGNMQHQIAMKVMGQSSTMRSSMDSDNSRFDLTGARELRQYPSISSDVISMRKDSQTSMDKGMTVTVTPMDDLEAQTLPTYAYNANRDER